MAQLMLALGIGFLTGTMMTVQGIINTLLAERVGTYGSIFVLTIVNLLLVGLVVLFFPGTLSYQNLPSWNRWYLYLGGVLGVFILAAIIVLLPRSGASLGFLYIIMGQMISGVIIEHFGLLGMAKAPFSGTKFWGVVLFVAGAYLVSLSKLKT
jgi:transporter family-2 protein